MTGAEKRAAGPTTAARILPFRRPLGKGRNVRAAVAVRPAPAKTFGRGGVGATAMAAPIRSRRAADQSRIAGQTRAEPQGRRWKSAGGAAKYQWRDRRARGGTASGVRLVGQPRGRLG